VNIWGKILYKGQSQYNGEIKVIEFFNAKRRLIASGFAQSRSLDKNGRSEFYWDAFSDNLGELADDASILILGLAAGTSASSIKRRFPNVEIDGVEIDPLMIELGKKYFDLDEKKINIFVTDAKTFVEAATKEYDRIFVDIFVGGEVPEFVYQDKFFEKLKALMKPNALVIVNKIYVSKGEINTILDFFKKHFKIVKENYTTNRAIPGNIILCGKAYD
jgi:spermidine synthase